MICPYCDREAPWVENKELYRKNYGKSYMCYYCKLCDAYVGCHNNTREPLGTMANRELRALRIQAHHYLDMHWNFGSDRRNRRTKVYSEMASYFGFDVHVGSADIELCNKIIEYAKSLARGAY